MKFGSIIKTYPILRAKDFLVIDSLIEKQTQSARLFLHTCVLPHTPTDGVAGIFSLTPMPQPGIKLTSVQMHLFEGP